MTPEEKLTNLRELAKLVTYDPETGIVIWKKREGNDRHTKMWNSKYAGMSVKTQAIRRGEVSGIRIRYKSNVFTVHHLIWVIVYDKLPDNVIDHINGNPIDNRITNLQDVTIQQNNKNAKLSKTNTSGAVGVYWHKYDLRWHAKVRIDGKLRHLGSFTDFEEAAKVARQARADLGFSERHGT